MQSTNNPTNNPFVDEYKSLVSWNYRPPAIPIHTPAIVRHLGFWIAGASVEVTSDQRRSLFRRLAKSIVASNADLNLRLENEPSKETDPDRRFLTFLIEGNKWRDMPLQIVLELHGEFIAMSVVLELELEETSADFYQKTLDFSLRHLRDGGPIPLELPPINQGSQRTGESTVGLTELTTAIHTVEVLGANRFNNLAKLKWEDRRSGRQTSDDLRVLLAEPYKAIFTTVWEQFDDQVLEKAVTQTWNECLSKLRQQDAIAPDGERPSDLGKIFADFRGFILPYERFATAVNALSGSDPMLLRFEQSDRKDVAWQDRSKAESDELSAHGVTLARSVLPFMTPEPEYKVRKELTASLFLHRRCFYASTLGSQPPIPGSTWQVDQPLTYCLMPVSLNSWQTGRLVDRLHRLGAVRLAAFRHLADLRNARHELKNLEDRLLTIEKPGTNPTAKELEECFTRLSEIKQSVPGGLAYRVERARYYRNQFVAMIRPLRIDKVGRIEGFQPYDQFVYGRFGDTFEFIDTLGQRLVRLDQQLRTKSDEFRTAELDRIRKETAEQTKKMKLLMEQITELQQTSAVIQRTTEKQLVKIKDLQIVGEFALFLVITPYYASQLLFHVFTQLTKCDCDKQVEFIATSLALLGGGFGLVLEKERRRRNALAVKKAQAAKLGAPPTQ